jgi:hypothetical protein
MSRQYFDAGGRPVNQFGTPVGPVAPLPDSMPPSAPPSMPASMPAPTGAPVYAGPQPPPPYGSGPPRRGRSTGATIAIALGATAAGLVILGILAAIAIPVFVNQRAQSEAEHISIALPAQVAGFPRMTGATDTQVQGLVAQLPNEAGSAQGAAYGVGRATVIVIAGRHLLLEKDRTAFLAEVAKSESGVGVLQTAVDAGPLGGRMQCGTAADGSRTDCAFADAGSYGVIDVAMTGPSAVALARQVRSEIETRH